MTDLVSGFLNNAIRYDLVTPLPPVDDSVMLTVVLIGTPLAIFFTACAVVAYLVRRPIG